MTYLIAFRIFSLYNGVLKSTIIMIEYAKMYNNYNIIRIYDYEMATKQKYNAMNKLKLDEYILLEKEQKELEEQIIHSTNSNDIKNIANELVEIENDIKSTRIGRINFSYENEFKNLLISKLMEIPHYHEKLPQNYKDIIYSLMFTNVSIIFNSIFHSHNHNDNINFHCDNNNINISWEVLPTEINNNSKKTARKLVY